MDNNILTWIIHRTLVLTVNYDEDMNIKCRKDFIFMKFNF